MRVCPECHRQYDDTVQFCIADAAKLLIVGSPDEDPLLNQVVGGKYRVEKKIGEGGMGKIYLGRHVTLGKRFAIKTLHADFTRNQEALERFRREAVTTAGLEHPHILGMADMDQMEDGTAYIVMEFLDGKELRSVLNEVHVLPLPRAVHIFSQVCRALAAAHDKSIVHRDMKPENVFLIEREGDPDFVKVLDFGISKIRQAGSKLTQTGMVIGTPHYMSPEQARGDSGLDHRSDIYTLGAMLYEALTGALPVQADNPTGVLVKILTEEPARPTAINPSIPPAVEGVILRAMAKDPNMRFGSCRDLSKALQQASGFMEGSTGYTALAAAAQAPGMMPQGMPGMPMPSGGMRPPSGMRPPTSGMRPPTGARPPGVPPTIATPGTSQPGFPAPAGFPSPAGYANPAGYASPPSFPSARGLPGAGAFPGAPGMPPSPIPPTGSMGMPGAMPGAVPGAFPGAVPMPPTGSAGPVQFPTGPTPMAWQQSATGQQAPVEKKRSKLPLFIVLFVVVAGGAAAAVYFATAGGDEGSPNVASTGPSAADAGLVKASSDVGAAAAEAATAEVAVVATADTAAPEAAAPEAEAAVVATGPDAGPDVEPDVEPDAGAVALADVGPDVAPEPSKVVITFVTQPQGAKVYEVKADGTEEQLCVTTCQYEFDRGDSEVQVVFRKNNFQPQPATFTPNDHGFVNVPLERVRQGSRDAGVREAVAVQVTNTPDAGTVVRPDAGTVVRPEAHVIVIRPSDAGNVIRIEVGSGVRQIDVGGPRLRDGNPFGH